jgi:preprotein translocase subunit YajC
VQELVPFLPLIGIALIFWLLVIRPQSRRQRELQRMQSSLEVGDRVMLTSGIHGTLRELGDNTVQVEIAPGVTVTVARGAVGKVVDTDEEAGRGETTETGEAGDAEEN